MSGLTSKKTIDVSKARSSRMHHLCSFLLCTIPFCSANNCSCGTSWKLTVTCVFSSMVPGLIAVPMAIAPDCCRLAILRTLIRAAILPPVPPQLTAWQKKPADLAPNSICLLLKVLTVDSIAAAHASIQQNARQGFKSCAMGKTELGPRI